MNRRKLLGIIGAALLAPKVCFAQKQLLPETQMIIDTVNSWNLKRGKIVRFIVDERLYKKRLAAIILFHEHHTQSYLEFADELNWPIDGANPVVVLKELASYFGGNVTCSNNKCYGLKVFIS
jgi:hypothetical protein